MQKRCQNAGDDRFVVWTMLLETHAALVDILESELDEVGGLPLTWYDVLAQLEMSPEGRLTMKELARSVLLSKSGITRLIDRMERAGMIERAACPADRRVVYAEVTPAGKALFQKAAPVHLRGIEWHFSGHLTGEEARIMRAGLDKVLSAAAALRDERPQRSAAS
jgi:DNA-binding MarR family transcriptional regulator